jgi:pimeloyl-ACP methyl ester carboxylesterase
MKKNKITLNGLKLIYYDLGQGKTILFLHGGRLRAVVFKKILTELSKHYRVIAPDIPGYGDSSTPPLPWSFTDYADFMFLFLKKLNLNDITVIGYSLGGGIALNLASKHKQINKLILVDSAGIEKQAISQLKIDFTRLLFYLASPQYISTFIILIIEWIFYTKKHLRHLNAVTNFRKYLSNSSGYPANLKMPTTIIWAENDNIFPVKIAKKLSRSIHGSRIFTTPGNHDWVLYNQPLFLDYLINSIA